MHSSYEKVTILVLASTFPRWQNDTEPRFVYDLCQGLKKDFNVIILTSHYPNAKHYEELNGLKIYRYSYAPSYFEKLVYNGGITTNLKRNKLKWLLIPSFLIGQFLSILFLIKKYKISIIHAHWLIPQGFLALVSKYFFKRHIKVLCTSHGGDLYGLNNPVSQKIKQWVLKKSDALTVVSSTMVKKSLELTPDIENKISVVPMGTNLKNTFTQSKNIIREKNLLLFVGRLVEKKGVDILISSIHEVKKTFPNIKLKIIGDGPDKSHLIKLSHHLDLLNQIEFIGKVSHCELALWYSKASAAVFPFREAKDGDVEGLGLVMIEALGCKCPVIAGNVPAVHDVILDNNTGMLFKSDSIAELTKKITSLLSKPSLAKSLAEAGHKHVMQTFELTEISEKYSSLIKQI